MKESIKQLFAKMNEDKVFAESILTQTDKGKVVELVKAQGIDFSLEDIDEANTLIQEAVKVEKSRTEGELSEEELENVAGGTFVSLLVASIGLIAGVSATVSGVASVAASVSVSITITANQD